MIFFSTVPTDTIDEIKAELGPVYKKDYETKIQRKN
eukprot:UN21503